MISRILVIDDNQDIYSVITDALDSGSYALEFAANPQEAKVKMQGTSHAMVICDIKMPGLDGISFYENLIAEGKAVPFLFISGELSVINAERISRLGNVAVLQKPFRLREIREQVRKILG